MLKLTEVETSVTVRLITSVVVVGSSFVRTQISIRLAKCSLRWGNTYYGRSVRDRRDNVVGVWNRSGNVRCGPNRRRRYDGDGETGCHRQN